MFTVNNAKVIFNNGEIATYCEPKMGKTAEKRACKEAQNISKFGNCKVVVRSNIFNPESPNSRIGYWWTTGDCASWSGQLLCVYENGQEYRL